MHRPWRSHCVSPSEPVAKLFSQAQCRDNQATTENSHLCEDAPAVRSSTVSSTSRCDITTSRRLLTACAPSVLSTSQPRLISLKKSTCVVVTQSIGPFADRTAKYRSSPAPVFDQQEGSQAMYQGSRCADFESALRRQVRELMEHPFIIVCIINWLTEYAFCPDTFVLLSDVIDGHVLSLPGTSISTSGIAHNFASFATRGVSVSPPHGSVRW